MTFDKLEKNLMDVIQEEQAKLGFRREKIRLYYPLSTLNHLLDTEDTAEQMETTLAGQPESMTRKTKQSLEKSKSAAEETASVSVFRRRAVPMFMSILRRQDLSMN